MPENQDRNESDRNIIMTPPPLENDFFARKCTRLEAQISSLKEVSSLRRDLLDIRSREVKNLIEKLKLFEEAIGAERQYRASLSTRVQAAEEKCVELTGSLTINNENLQRIKENYQEKINQLAQDLEKSDAAHHRTTDELNDSEMRNIDLNTRVEEYAKLIQVHEKNVKDLKAELKIVSERNQAFSDQINLLNTLFNEIEGTPIDFDRIRAIGDIVRETHNMPIISEPSQPSTSSQEEDHDDIRPPASPRRASIDFDSIIDQIDTDKHTGEIPGEESCYKKVTTVHGPQLVLSVSQTFIKLKDLILEKKSLQREIDSLKNLNTKLELKVDRQERRLFQVGSELNKTWNLVAKLKNQHSKLHTSKAVLKYELHEKRKLLEKLKEELSYSRQQYAQVRLKHNESEILCQSMRADFARRRQASSLESGAFSDVSDSPVSFSNSSEEPMSCEDPEIQLAMQNSTTDDDDEEEEEETQEVLDEEDNEDYDMEIDPIQNLVSDLVEEMQAVTAEEEATIEQPDGDDATRASRLRMLEEASRILYSRLMATTAQSSALSSRLAQLHNHYGSHDLPISEPFEPVEETTVDTESTTTDVAYASNNNTSHNAADDTEVDSQYEDASLPITHRNSQALNGSMEMIHEDMLTEGVENVEMTFDAAAVPSTSTATGATLKAVAGAGPMTVETQTDLAVAGPSTHRCEDCDAQLENVEEGSSESSSPDPNCLSRLIIQQVPKRLEMLKLQNLSMREKEQVLTSELKKQRRLLESIQAEKVQLAAEFENRMRSREDEIKTLHDKITELASSGASRGKENMRSLEKYTIEAEPEAGPSSGTQIQQSDSSKCGSCTKKFTIFGRRKHKCNVCLQKFCQDCCKSVVVQGRRETARMCSVCQSKNILLETATKISIDNQKKLP